MVTANARSSSSPLPRRVEPAGSLQRAVWRPPLGGIGAAPEGYPGHVTFYVAVPDVEAALAKAESLGGSRMMGPDKVMEGVEIGLFNDPEGHLVGVVKSAS